MKIIPINDETRSHGYAVLDPYLTAALCGPGIGEAYERTMRRQGGTDTVPGIIDALLDRGIDETGQVVCAAARMSRCRRATVQAVLDALTGPDPAASLYYEQDGRLFHHDRCAAQSLPRFLLAA